MSSNLDAPLGGRKVRSFRRPGRPREWPLARGALALSALIIAIAVLRVALVNDPEGGRASATVDISATRDANAVAHEVTLSAEDAAKKTGTAEKGPTDGPQITEVDKTTKFQSAVSELTAFGVDPELAEETQNGPIPHVAPNGRTPFSAYARASVGPAGANGKPLVAIVVTGLGLSESITLDAIDTLPDNVTLAFAPYGATLGRTTAAARAQGHEMLLQVPLEPFDFPDSDPGPKTLLTGQPPRANLDKLFWLMSRFGGYFGLTNYMGARFTSSAADFEPVMEELGTRGLGYLDDGSSNRSLAPQMAERNKVPFARANLELDTKPSRAAILEKLDELEATAREKGAAIGIISALPVSIKTVADWARKLDDKNMMLVPVSALMRAPQNP